MRAIVILIVCVVFISSFSATTLAATTDSGSFFDSILNLGKKWFGNIGELDIKDVNIGEVLSVGKKFGLDDVPIFKYIGGTDSSLSLGNFDFEFNGWSETPQVSWKDPVTKTETNLNTEGASVVSNIFDFKWDSFSSVVKKVAGIVDTEFSSEKGFDKYVQPKTAPSILTYEYDGWKDDMDNLLSAFNFGFMPAIGIPGTEFQSGKSEANAEAAKRIGANVQGMKYINQLAITNLENDPNRLPTDTEDLKILKSINQDFDKIIGIMTKNNCGPETCVILDSIKTGEMSDSAVESMKQETYPVLNGILVKLNSLSVKNRPYTVGDTCEGRCLKACKTVGTGLCVSGYKCCSE